MRKLKGLVRRGTLIPVGGAVKKLLARLTTVVEDGGRYCICDGFNDGSLMLGCEVCSKWFHAKCVLKPGALADKGPPSLFICAECTTKRAREAVAKPGNNSLALQGNAADHQRQHQQQHGHYQHQQQHHYQQQCRPYQQHQFRESALEAAARGLHEAERAFLLQRGRERMDLVRAQEESLGDPARGRRQLDIARAPHPKKAKTLHVPVALDHDRHLHSSNNYVDAQVDAQVQ